MNIFNIKFIGEVGDTLPIVTRTNAVIKTSLGKWKLMEHSTWDNWEMCLIFPDNEKVQYFLNTFKNNMLDYRDGMLKEDYIFHVVHFKYPKVESLYADQLKMKKDWRPYDI